MLGEQPTAAQAEFEGAMRVHGRRLHSICLAILRDPMEAEDAVQEAMESAWRSWSALRDAAAREAWLVRICVRHSMRRRHGLLRRWLLRDDAGTADAGADMRVRDVDLHRAFGRLSLGQRAVVALHYQHGYTLDESAEIMGCRPGTARSHLARALSSLRTELGDD
jgi:RNA polymerase sigma-70 factor, ECF subfamily